MFNYYFKSLSLTTRFKPLFKSLNLTTSYHLGFAILFNDVNKDTKLKS